MTKYPTKEQIKRYPRIVYWSDEDNCFIGTCPELMLGGVHGDDPKAVFAELCQAIEEWIELLENDRCFPNTRKSLT
jgi:predicted RNase H-like HicB family nuclease